VSSRSFWPLEHMFLLFTYCFSVFSDCLVLCFQNKLMMMIMMKLLLLCSLTARCVWSLFSFQLVDVRLRVNDKLQLNFNFQTWVAWSNTKMVYLWTVTDLTAINDVIIDLSHYHNFSFNCNYHLFFLLDWAHSVKCYCKTLPVVSWTDCWKCLMYVQAVWVVQNWSSRVFVSCNKWRRCIDHWHWCYQRSLWGTMPYAVVVGTLLVVTWPFL